MLRHVIVGLSYLHECLESPAGRYREDPSISKAGSTVSSTYPLVCEACFLRVFSPLLPNQNTLDTKQI